MPAYQMLADALRARILTRELLPGQKLPTEPELAEEYGVSRSTVREALRVLASRDLITTSRGVLGGSFVACPSPQQMSNYLQASLGLLAQSEDMAVQALLEARDILEVPAAGLAAVRRTAADLEALRRTLCEPTRSDPREVVTMSRAFHETLLHIAGNPILEALARPVFEVMYERMLPIVPPVQAWCRFEDDHRLIYEAVAAGDAGAARAETQLHLQKLRTLSR